MPTLAMQYTTQESISIAYPRRQFSNVYSTRDHCQRTVASVFGSFALCNCKYPIVGLRVQCNAVPFAQSLAYVLSDLFWRELRSFLFILPNYSHKPGY